MTINEIWENSCASIVKIALANDDRIMLSSGTGFFVGDRLITNYHVINSINSQIIQLITMNPDGSPGIGGVFKRDSFVKNLVDCMPENSWDFAIYHIDGLKKLGVNGLNLSKDIDFPIGLDIAIIGFPFSSDNPSVSKGIISSKFIKNGVAYLQLDCNVNQGNSGGPVIRTDTGEVIGLVTRKAHGLTNAIGELKKIHNDAIVTADTNLARKNIDFNTRNWYNYYKVNSSHTLAYISELERSANVGIGYAFQLTEVNRSFEHH